MRKTIATFTLASALLLAGCAKEKISQKPERTADTISQEQKIDPLLYTDKEEKKYFLPDDFYMTDPNFMDSKDTLDSLIRKADHDMGFLRWNYGFNDQYDFGLPKSDDMGTDLQEDPTAFKNDKKFVQILEFRQSLMERKGAIEREQIESVENYYKPINFVDYERAINSQAAVSNAQILQMASKFQGYTINKIFYKEEDKSRIKVLHWNKEKALSVSEVEVDPSAFDQFLAVYSTVHSEKKQELCGAMYIPFNQYQAMKNISQQDMSAVQIFGQIENGMPVNAERFLSVSDLGEKGVRVFSAGKGQETKELELPAGSMETIQKYYDATKNL